MRAARVALPPAAQELLAVAQREILATTGIFVPASRIVEAALKAWSPASIDERRPGQGGVQGDDDHGVDPTH